MEIEEYTGQELLLCSLEGIFVLVHTNRAPREEEWDSILALLRSRPASLTSLRTLVFTDGGAPSASQRRRLDEAMEGRVNKTAVVSSAAIPRFVVASIALLSRRLQIRAFTPEEAQRAYAYLQLSPEEVARIEGWLRGIPGRVAPRRLTSLARALSL